MDKNSSRDTLLFINISIWYLYPCYIDCAITIIQWRLEDLFILGSGSYVAVVGILIVWVK